MNKQKFTKIIQNYHNIPDDDREKLHELAKNYPYSQVIHTLIAKANHDAQTPIASQTLNYAAMYATDRTVLKDVIQHTSSHATEQVKPAPVPPARKEATEMTSSIKTQVGKIDDQAPVTKEKKKITVNTKDINPESDLIRDEIWFDLEALKRSKAAYMEWLQDGETGITGEAPSPTMGDEAEKKQPKKTVKKQAEASPEIKAEGRANKNKTTKAKKQGGEKSKKKKKVAKPLKEDQKKIIENFISREPSITAKPLKSSENQPDLSAASTSFNEDLVSENLANIFINQGKKGKAIDIYKKLIWKFPQKKAYFASRIEELQK